MTNLTQPEPNKQHFPSLDLTIPNFKLKSPNSPEHWTSRHARVKKEKRLITLSLAESGHLNTLYQLPCSVVFTRISPRPFDSDNLISSLKNCRDFISSLIIPGLAPGRADSSDFISWHYEQIRGEKNQYALNIKIYQT